MRGRVLICGDRAYHDNAIVGAFERTGWEVQGCEDWHHWRDVASETHPDLLVIELAEPEAQEEFGLSVEFGHDEGPDAGFRLPDTGVDLAELEKSLLQQALERTGGNQSAAARLLGISRYALRYRVEKYNL